MLGGLNFSVYGMSLEPGSLVAHDGVNRSPLGHLAIPLGKAGKAIALR